MLKRITFAVNRLDSAGGAERVIAVLSSRLVEIGVEVTIVTRQSQECVYPLDNRVKIIATSVSGRFSLLRNIKRNLKLREAIKKSNPDVIISFMTPMNIQTIFYTLGLRIPIIISERNNPETDISKRDKFLTKLLYPKCDGIVFQTEQAKRWFSKKIQEKGIIIPNPISENLPSRKKIVSGRIVTVGRLEKQKNHKLLIDAFGEYSKENIQSTLTIYGQGSMKAELEEYISYKNLREKVFLAGYRKDVMEAISDAELFVLSSDYEGMPNALIEAMGIGLPCISTDCPCGGSAFLIKDGVNGWLTPVGDVESMLNTIRKAMSKHEVLNEISREGIQIRDRLNSHNIAETWLKFCEEKIK